VTVTNRPKTDTVVLSDQGSLLQLTVITQVDRNIQIVALIRIKEICYGYRYTEKKVSETAHPWVIRQSGLYHQYDYTSGRSTFIVLSPLVESAFEQSLKTLLASPAGNAEITTNPFLLHHMLVSTHLPDMRGYLLYFENQINPIVSFRGFCVTYC
jgi:hypothetical protein